MDSLQEKINDYDFVRLTTPDIHGSHLSKLIPKRHAQKIVSGGVDMCSGAIAFGPRAEFLKVPEVLRIKYANGPLKPIPETFHPLPWATDHETGRTVCEVICETCWPDGSSIQAHPRYVARKQVDKLTAMGYRIYSSFEPEFRAFKPGTFEPYATGVDIFKAGVLCQYEKFFMTADTQLFEAGVELEDLSNEYGSGQLETPLKPRDGVESADAAFIFKQAIREIGRNHNMTISFMTQPIPEEFACGWHYNHSLWDIKTGANVMYDKTASDGLSKIAHYWLGGILKHLVSICALCCPTVNCYRRINHHDAAPTWVAWDLDSRMTTLRVKTGSEKGTYVENRMPSSACNPYNVMAATLAAGIDGIVNQIEPPPRGNKEYGKLPANLRDALTHLEKDEVIVDSLGSQFIDWFVRVKREADLVVLDGIDLDLEKEEDFARERKEYFQFI